MKEMKKRLGDMLVELGRISKEQLEEELKKQRTSGKRLGELLIEDGLISEDEMLSVLEVQLDIPRIYPEIETIDQNAIKSIPESIAAKYTLLPIYFKEDKLCIIMSDPLNIFALDDVKIASGYDVQPMLASSQEIKEAIKRYYSNEFVQKAAQELSKEQIEKGKTSKDNIESENLDDIKNAPVVKLVDSIVDNAVKARASDIHIEPFEEFVRVRYRVDGQMHEMLRSPKETLGVLTTRLKILAGLNIAERRIPQDGRIFTSTDGNPVDLRVSVLPTVHGEKIVIRILKRDSFLIDKAGLGMSQSSLDRLEKILKSPNGIILVTGPTGSGKSTTLYTMLNELNTTNINIITIEDPVEYMVEGINQVNVNTKAGLTFAAGLRSMLRQDPDVIMVGEIRDSETAEIAVRAAITGHLVLSTIHTNDAPSTITRLTDMGIQNYLTATSLSGVIAQRLIRTICTNCKEGYEASEYEKKILGINNEEKLMLSRGTGCKQCNNLGYKGRQGIYEVMDVSPRIKEAIITNKSSEDIKKIALEEGMQTLSMSCRDFVLEGITTIDEYIKISFIKD